jgi:DNA-binding NarL/FixJ family response regulator
VEVLQLIVRGAGNQEIADALAPSARTVARHSTKLYAKTDARGKADATAYHLRTWGEAKRWLREGPG